jgi:NADH:ubiquinone oxidoreductase subunit 2 (subunit N)
VTADMLALFDIGALALPAAILFVGATLALASPWPRASWLCSLAAATGAFIVSVEAALRAMPGAATSSASSVTQSAMSAALVALVCGLALLVVIASAAWVHAAKRHVAPLALALAMAACGGWVGALAAGDLLTLLIAMEAAWLASVGLAAIAGDQARGALSGSFRMLMSGAGAAVLFVLGAALLGRAVGGYDLATLPVAQIEASGAAAIGIAFIVTALAAKAGLKPMGVWAAAVAGRVNGMPLLIIAVVGQTGAMGVLSIWAAAAILAPSIGDAVSVLLAAFGVLCIAIGAFRAMAAGDLRRLAVHAWVAQAGIALLCLALGSQVGVAAALVQIAAMSAMSMALLAGFSAGIARDFRFASLDGLAGRAPLASAAIAAGALSFMGAPLTLGFLGRWRLVEAGVGAGWWWAAIAVIAVSLAGVFCGGRLIERMYFRRAEAAVERAGGWRWTYAPALIAAIAATIFGLAPSALLRVAEIASDQAFGGAP